MESKIEILNLKCGGCANSIKKGLHSVEGVQQVEVDLDHSIVKVHTIDQTTVDAVKEKLSKMGYPAADEENTLMHKAKSFVSCATGRMGKEIE
jgi:copper chaperone